MAGDDWRALATQVAAGRGPWRLPTRPPTRPEQMLALTAHARPTEDETTQARTLGQELSAAEWREVMALAQSELLTTLVYAQIGAMGLLPLLPPEVAASFAEQYRETLLTNLHIRTALERLLDQLATARIGAISLKGVVLVERLYGNLGWRRVRDIDLLVRHADADQVALLLRNSGYIPERGQEHAHDFWAIASTEMKFTHEVAPVIETHWSLSKIPAYRRGLAADALWTRTLTETWHGRTVRVLAPSDELRYLAVHCTADHASSPLHWLVDIAELVRGLPAGWRWDSFVAETIALGLATPVGLALAQLRAVLNLDAPEDALAEMLRAALSREERAAWQLAGTEILSRTWIAAHLRAMPSPHERALFATHALARVALQTTRARLSLLSHWSARDDNG